LRIDFFGHTFQTFSLSYIGVLHTTWISSREKKPKRVYPRFGQFSFGHTPQVSQAKVIPGFETTPEFFPQSLRGSTWLVQKKGQTGIYGGYKAGTKFIPGFLGPLIGKLFYFSTGFSQTQVFLIHIFRPIQGFKLRGNFLKGILCATGL